MLPLIEELGMLAFEWTHKTLDVLYADVFGLGDDASQKASAWTLLLLGVGLLAWLGYVLRLKYLKAKAAAPAWWEGRKLWWSALPWPVKLAYIAGGLGVAGVLVMII